MRSTMRSANTMFLRQAEAAGVAEEVMTDDQRKTEKDVAHDEVDRRTRNMVAPGLLSRQKPAAT